MYSKPFYITDPIWNNTFSFERRTNPQLYVPNLQQISSFDEVELLNSSEWKVTFEDYDFDDVLQTCYGLKNLYELNSLLNPLPFQEKGATRPKIYVVDNHNHVFYFWYLARNQGIISDNALLYHIDEHADTRDPWKYLLKPDSEDLKAVYQYTNFTLNVGNYIIPAQKEGLIWEVVQIRSEEALNEYELWKYTQKETWKSIILNLDLDFFEPELDFIDYNLKKQVILDIASKTDLITVCTSPFFIDQRRALEVLRDIFE